MSKAAYNWYVAQPTELMIDLDHKDRPLPDGTMPPPDPAKKPYKLYRTRARIKGARDAGVLPVTRMFLYPSDSELHYHVILVLREPWTELRRAIWQSYLGDDYFRSLNNLYRAALKIPASNLLITREPYRDFYRLPDDCCNCPSKHSQEVMATCPAAYRLRGKDRTSDYFPKPIEPTTPIRYGEFEL